MKTNNLQLSLALVLGILAVTGALTFLGILGEGANVVYAQGDLPQGVETNPGHNQSGLIIANQGQLLTRSNRITETTIIIDPNREGWDKVTPYPDDPARDGGGTGNIDWRAITMAHDADELYIRYEVEDGPLFNPGGFRYNLFVDVDGNRTTGFRGTGRWLSIGADLLFQGAYDAASAKILVYRFTGTNQEEWKWTLIKAYLANDKALSGTKRDIEWKVPMSDLNIFGIRVVRFDWVAFGDSANGVYDFYPDGGNGGDAGDFYTYQTPMTQMLIPLYSYPNWNDPNYIWDDVAAAACYIPITAIINPANGPGSGGPDSNYQHGLNDLRNAGVTILGYVDTNYSTRPITDVKAEVDQYDQYFNIHGIFFDRVTSSADKLPYYQDLYKYVKSKHNLDGAKVILNPGTHIDEGYIKEPPASDIAVIFEGPSSDWPGYIPDPYVFDYPAERFAMLVHSVLPPDAGIMRSHLDLAVARNIGYGYVTDDTPPNPYDRLPTFWQDEVSYIKSLNGNATPSRFCLYLPLIRK